MKILLLSWHFVAWSQESSSQFEFEFRDECSSWHVLSNWAGWQMGRDQLNSDDEDAMSLESEEEEDEDDESLGTDDDDDDDRLKVRTRMASGIGFFGSYSCSSSSLISGDYPGSVRAGLASRCVGMAAQ